MFFETYFGFKAENSVVNDTISILRADDGFVLVLMSDKLNKGDNSYPGTFHIGLFQETDEAVTTVYERLKNAGAALADEPKRIRKTFGFYFKYQDILIEISTDIKE